MVGVCLRIRLSASPSGTGVRRWTSATPPLFRRALALDERSSGPDHPDVATDLNNLARMLRATNRLAEAESLARRGVRILIEFQHRTEHEHPNFRAVLANYLGLLQALGKTLEEIEQ